jgi:RNA polymerase sigma-70 factor (ECF subfamily)
VTRATLQSIAAGDKNAVQDCLKAYGGLVWSLARRMLRNSEDAEDAVQEIFIDVWKNAGRFDPSQSSETTSDSIEDMVVEPADSTAQNLQTTVEGREAFEALKALRPEQRQVLELSIIQGLSHQEISDATGMPLGTVKTHARRGILQARENLGLGKSGLSKEVPV